MNRYLRIAIILLAGTCCFILLKEIHQHHLFLRQQAQKMAWISDTLRCSIYLPARNAARVDYHYEMLQRFAHLKKYYLKYEPVKDSTHVWQMLLDHSTDIMAINIISDSIPKFAINKICISPLITEMGEVWITAKDRCPWHGELSFWVTSFKQSKEYSRFYHRFFPISKTRSPYDSLLVASSKGMGWDWRLLRSIMYQESKYRMNAYSSRKAIGLMQIKESTALEMGFSDPFNPEENIQAACAYFRYLERNMNLDSIPPDQQMHFILAAYNAGMGRIESDRGKALADGKNPNRWEDVSLYAPEATDEYLNEIWNRYYLWTGEVTSSE